MKRYGISIGIVAALLLPCLASERTFVEETDVFMNPGQGWSSMGTGYNWKQNQDLVNLGAVYNRFAWRSLEPRDGEYNWKPIDDLIQFAASKGVPASFRVMCANSGSDMPETPDWVWSAGATYDEWESRSYSGKVVTNRAPHFDNPEFLRLHHRFIEAMAKRYDGDPRIAGIDLGSYGNWGEWHCHGLPPNAPAKLPAKGEKVKQVPAKKYPYEIRRQYVDMYLENFRKTTIVFMSDDWECLRYAMGTGPDSRVGIRRDGVGSPWHFKRWIGKPPYDQVPGMGDIWKSRPMWFEFYGGGVSCVLKNGWDLEYSFKWLLENHVTVVNTCPFNPWEAKDMPEVRALMKQIDLYAGARFVPLSAKVARTDTGLSVAVKSVNKGVARLHLPYELIYEARDVEGKVLFSTRGAANPGDWLPGPFEWSDKLTISKEVLSKTAKFVVRLRHTAGIFRDFRFAARGLDSDNVLLLSDML